MSEIRGSGREEQPHAQGAMAVRAQEGLEELSQVEGHEQSFFRPRHHQKMDDNVFLFDFQPCSHKKELPGLNYSEVDQPT